MIKSYFKRVVLKGLHKRYNIDIRLKRTLNILHGPNGTGKSTLLHIITNIANCDFLRFALIDFTSIRVEFYNKKTITISQHDIPNEKLIKIQIFDEKNSYKNEFEFSKLDAVRAINASNIETVFSENKTTLVEHELKQFLSNNEFSKTPTSYFPAFRTMLEAISSKDDEPRRFRSTVTSLKATKFSRDLLGEFLPTINFPSPTEIESNLKEEIRDAQIAIARYESSIFSESFVAIFSALINGDNTNHDAAKLLSEIAELTASTQPEKSRSLDTAPKEYAQLQALVSQAKSSSAIPNNVAAALAVYKNALLGRKEKQKSAYEEIDKYLNAVNYFLNNKEISYELDPTRRTPKVGLRFPDGSWSSIRSMSSGERQLLTMLYAVNKMSGSSVVLIDEPEISLHIDWQEELIGKMLEHLGERQIIVCTHSPAIASDFAKYMTLIKPEIKTINKGHSSSTDEEEMI